ncbi:hypothetical protein AAE478_004168 [Parahypoxylon ruwenzoriense]
MPGLAASRWAPRPKSPRTRWALSSSSSASSDPPVQLLSKLASSTPPQPQPQQNQLSPDRELSRFLKIVARLNWKLPFLKQGYTLAKDSVGKSPVEVEMCEIQFKLDFHEFYMLIERALVRLMSIYGIVVDGNPRTNPSLDADGGMFRGQHRYHANVLAALDDPENPLNGIFGVPEVRKQLFRAKELRNRWKHADKDESRRFTPPPLETYNLEQVVTTILQAIDEAHTLTVQYIHDNVGEPIGPPNPASEEEDWEFMVDAMDWEAV